MQHRVYHRQIHSVDELKRRLIDVWCGLEQSIFDEATDQWRGRYPACVHAKGGHFEYSSELTKLILSIYVTFHVICLTVASSITKSCQQRRPIHSCSFTRQRTSRFEVWWQILWHALSQLIFVCNSERIIKIGLYLPKLCSNRKGSSFFDSVCQWFQPGLQQQFTYVNLLFVSSITCHILTLSNNNKDLTFKINHEESVHDDRYKSNQSVRLCNHQKMTAIHKPLSIRISNTKTLQNITT